MNRDVPKGKQTAILGQLQLYAALLCGVGLTLPAFAQQHYNYDGSLFVPQVEITAVGLGASTQEINRRQSSSITDAAAWSDGDHAIYAGPCYGPDMTLFFGCTIPDPRGNAFSRVVGDQGTIKLYTYLEQGSELVNSFYTATAKADVRGYVRAVGPPGMTSITFELPFDGSANSGALLSPSRSNGVSTVVSAQISLEGEVLDAPPQSNIDPLPTMGLSVYSAVFRNRDATLLSDNYIHIEKIEPLQPIADFENATGRSVADKYTFFGLTNEVRTTVPGTNLLFPVVARSRPAPAVTMKVPANTQIPVFVRVQVESICRSVMSCTVTGKFDNSFYVAAKPATGYTIESTGPFKLVGQNFVPPPPNPGTLAFSTSQIDVDESAGSVSVTVLRTGGSSGAVSVNVVTSTTGSATPGSDFSAVNTRVDFLDGDAASKTVSIPILADNVVESDETIAVTLSSVTGGAQIGTQATAQITIKNSTPNPVTPPGSSGSGGGGGGCATASGTGAGGMPDPTLPLLLFLSGFWVLRSLTAYL